MSFAIVVDSVADLSEEECARFGITSVPLSVEVGGETFKDQAEISSEEFYDKMIASDTLPKSSHPSPSEFMDIYNALPKALMRSSRSILLRCFRERVNHPI